jgi:hypothetical protein
MLASGEIRIIENEEIKAWRGSMGLLGLALGVKVRLRRCKDLDMTYHEVRLEHWNEEGVNAFVSKIISRHDAAEFFYDIYSDTLSTLCLKYIPEPKIQPRSVGTFLGLLVKDFDKGPTTFEHAQATPIYEKMLAANKDLALPGEDGTTVSETKTQHKNGRRASAKQEAKSTMHAAERYTYV